jgi:hypothetical protein
VRAKSYQSTNKDGRVRKPCGPEVFTI